MSAVENPNFEYGHNGDPIAALAAARRAPRASPVRRHAISQINATAAAAATALPSATAALGSVSGLPICRPARPAAARPAR